MPKLRDKAPRKKPYKPRGKIVLSDADYPLQNLKPQHYVFMRAYMRTMSATLAYKEAFPEAGHRTACVNGGRLLKHPLIVDELQPMLDARAERLDLKADKVLAEIAKIAFADVTQLFNEDGSIKDPWELDSMLSAAVQSFEYETLYELQSEGRGRKRKVAVGRLTKVKMYNKLDALEKAGKHLKLFVERHEHTGKNGAPLIPDGATELDVARRIAFILSRGKKGVAPKKPTT